MYYVIYNDNWFLCQEKQANNLFEIGNDYFITNVGGLYSSVVYHDDKNKKDRVIGGVDNYNSF